MKNTVTFLFVLLLFINTASAQLRSKQFTEKADSLINIRLPDIAPGAVVLVANKGKVLYKKAFGVVDIHTNAKMKTDHIFRIGSVGKQFTAVAILQLAEQEKLSLKDSIQQFIPDFPSKGHRITIAHLLSQTSGIRNYFELETDAGQEEISSYSPKQVIDIFKTEPLQFVPGSAFQYSNSNYFLLGYIIEKVSGLSYKEYLIKNVVEKAGLKSTFYIDPARNESRRATPYSRFDGKLEAAELQSANLTYAAGALESTADDLLKWQRALQSGKLIKAETLRQAISPYKLADGTNSEYGFGWFIRNIDGESTVEHSGSTDGYQTDVLYMPDQDIYIVTLFNCYESDMDWQVLTNDIAKLSIGKSIGSLVTLTPEQLKKYTGNYEVFAGTVSHQMRITLEGSDLFVEALNPNDRLPKVQLYAEKENKFYIKEAPLKFEFVRTEGSDTYTLVTYNNRGKDAEWKKL
ncbi:hypothetical protein GCM10009120_51110 [Sphingobacterium siyangense subsp. cladoniae]|uniref:serine hydrolase n=1 Tax=Sphingobacterium siyangense TaxID=459529 RepID=UPI0031FA42B9